jgi:lambda family phage portal protein
MNRHAHRSFFKRTRDAVAAFVRGYDAAGLSGRYPFQQSLPAPATAGLGAAPIIGPRAADAVVNDPHIAAVLLAFVTDIVGADGPSLQHDDDAITKAWARFWSNCDAEGISDLAHLLVRVVRCFVIYGEAFVLFRVDRETGALRLLVLPPSQIDRNANEDLGDGGWVVAGIHIARDGRRLRYRVLRTSPDHPFATSTDADWIDASEVRQIADPIFPGELRPVSPLASILTRAVETDTTIDAKLKQQQVAALLCVFLTDPTGQVTLGKMIEQGTAELKPGTTNLVPEGVTANVVTPPDAKDGVDFIKHMLRSMAAGVGLPAWKVSADLSDVNFSSARLGDFAWRRRVGQLQKLIEGQLLTPIFKRWLALEVAADRLDVDLNALANPVWLWPAWTQIDPKAETEADEIAVRNGFTSRRAVISKYGRDPDEVAAEIAADRFTPTNQPALKVVQNA